MDKSYLFTEKADAYHSYRPSYPLEVISVLKQECELNSEFWVADIGAGTGKLTELLYPHVKQVIAIEPNEKMRRFAEKSFLKKPNIVIKDASAEDTTLGDKSVDLIVAAQSFNWFKPNQTKKEFNRILKDRGHVVLLWNDTGCTQE